MKNALLVTQSVDTGPDGDVDPFRPIARLKVENATTDAARLAARRTPDVISAFRSIRSDSRGSVCGSNDAAEALFFRGQSRWKVFHYRG